MTFDPELVVERNEYSIAYIKKNKQTGLSKIRRPDTMESLKTSEYYLSLTDEDSKKKYNELMNLFEIIFDPNHYTKDINQLNPRTPRTIEEIENTL